jgi:hypothetical protein
MNERLRRSLDGVSMVSISQREEGYESEGGEEKENKRRGQVRDWVSKTMASKRGKRIRKGPGMPCVD